MRRMAPHAKNKNKIHIAEKRGTEAFFRSYARRQYHEPGSIEIEKTAKVRAAKGGAYVQGWIYVPSDVSGVSEISSNNSFRGNVDDDEDYDD